MSSITTASSLIFQVSLFLASSSVSQLHIFYFEKKIELPVPSPDRAANVLLMLNPTERKIIAQIVADKGQSLQSDISRLEGIGKVKAHRTIDKLIKRGVIEKEEKGKTNILKLKKEIKDEVPKYRPA